MIDYIPISSNLATIVADLVNQNTTIEEIETQDGVTEKPVLRASIARAACEGNCSGSCSGSCSSSCTGQCKGSCKGTCTGTCTGSCTGGCKGSCKGECKGSCKGQCTGNCQTNCEGVCAKACQTRCENDGQTISSNKTTKPYTFKWAITPSRGSTINISASSWNTFGSYIKSVSSYCGTTVSISSVRASDPISAAAFNNLSNAINKLNSSNNAPIVVKDQLIEASLFTKLTSVYNNTTIRDSSCCELGQYTNRHCNQSTGTQTGKDVGK